MRKAGSANDNAGTAELHTKLDLLLAESKLVLQQLGRLTSELRDRKTRSAKRMKTIRARLSPDTGPQPSEQEISTAAIAMLRNRKK